MMHLNKFEYVNPSSLSEVLEFLGGYGTRAKLVAGGTDFIVQMKEKRIAPEVIPGPLDLPPIKPILVEPVDPNGPFGAKGIGEPALNPVPAAVANAIYHAIGVRITELPISPEKILNGLKAKK